MIRIRCVHPENEKSFTLLANKRYKIGRRDGDITFPEDKSISKFHAEVIVEHPLSNMAQPMLTPTVCLIDMGSKYGTFVNGERLTMRDPCTLSPGSTFKLGKYKNEYMIEYTPLILTLSNVSDDVDTGVIVGLKRAINTLGGHLVAEWTLNCSYVVMSEISLTMKAICALFGEKWIVTPNFVIEMLERVRMGKALPSPKEYLPPLVEQNIQGLDKERFEPYSGRKELLVGKVFAFTTKRQMKRIGPAVETGGGKCLLITDVKNSLDLLKDNYIVMKSDEQVDNVNILRMLDGYTKKKKRLIHESEVGLAALYFTTSHHCNPYHTFQD